MFLPEKYTEVETFQTQTLCLAKDKYIRHIDKILNVNDFFACWFFFSFFNLFL